MAKLQAGAVDLRALDANALPLSGAKCKVYRNNTTAPVTTYSNAAMTSAQAWPVVADSAGRFASIYLPNGAYTIRVETSAGALIWTSNDNIVVGATNGGVITPEQYGAVGDNQTNTGTDDGAALNLAFAALRTAVAASTDGSGAVILDLQGLSYKTTIPLDATNIVGFNWQVRNGTIWGHCTGKAVIDASGSRGGHWENILIYGDSTNIPRTGWQAARVDSGFYGAGQNIDRNLIEKMHIRGYFTVSAHYALGQESTTYLKCSFWNENLIGTAHMHVGYPFVSFISDFITPISSATSNIHNQYIGCDFVSLPTGRRALIASITQANPAVVTTTAAHPFVDGEEVNLSQISGMTGANSKYGTVANATATTFELVGLDTSAMSAHTANTGAAVKTQTGPTIRIGRISSTRYIGCYVVNYGSASIKWETDPGSTPSTSVELDFLYEGAPKYQINFAPSSGALNTGIYDFRVTSQGSIAGIGMIAATGYTSGGVNCPGAYISFPRNSYYGVPMFISPGDFSFGAGHIVAPDASQFDPALLNGFTGTYFCNGDTSPNLRSVILSDLPTSDPGVPGLIWRDAGAGNVLKLSV